MPKIAGIIMDFSYNLLKYDENLSDYITRLYSQTFYQTDAKPESNATLIDHICCNKLQLYQFSIIIDTTTTDHFQTISTFITDKTIRVRTQN